MILILLKLINKEFINGDKSHNIISIHYLQVYVFLMIQHQK